MSRLFTSGAERDNATQDGVVLSGATYTKVSPITANWSWNATETTGAQQRVTAAFNGGVTDVIYYAQARLRFDSDAANWGQASGTDVLCLRNAGNGRIDAQLRLDATGHPMLFATGLQRGSTGPTPLVAGVPYVVELASLISAGPTDYAELRINGVSIASISANLSGTAATEFVAGSLETFPLATVNITVDDLVLNSDSGSAPDNTWPNGVTVGVATVDTLAVQPIRSLR